VTEGGGLPSLDVTVKLRELPAEVRVSREREEAENAANEKVARPRIAAVATACRLVLQDLEQLHRTLADVTDLNLTGYSRASALWLLSGRCIGLLRAVLTQVEAGICHEAVATGRALHEAASVLMAFGDPDQAELVRLWLDDAGRPNWVKPKAARQANARYEDRLAEAMRRSGLPEVPSTEPLEEDLYHRLSVFAHSRRSSIVSAVSDSGRWMAYGYHPSAVVRASYVSWGAAMTVATTNAVGDALRAFHGGDFFSKRIKPLQTAIEAVRETSPLDEAAIRAAAQTLE
jgi:hypothetical protein